MPGVRTAAKRAGDTQGLLAFRPSEARNASERGMEGRGANEVGDAASPTRNVQRHILGRDWKAKVWRPKAAKPAQ